MRRICSVMADGLIVTADDATEEEVEAATVRMAEFSGLVQVIRWALGEEGEFVDAPEELHAALVRGRYALGIKPHETPLYWWRSELRRRFDEVMRKTSTRGVKTDG